ncbi:MAG: extracellular solute-binding protein [Pseudomonadota bacterium]|nr:extracellular solute-binding protein [Pseudomonadota bacterium]|tara:strand:- start:624 stop:2468 length:1845 start_codon:yes stop_codon:yes gene_type:complete
MDYNQFMRNFRFCVWVLVLVLGGARSLMADAVLSDHAMTMFDNEIPKYTTTFPYFDYVNPTAPKGGTLRLAVDGTFDSFNSFIPKGNAASTGSVETLLVNSADEPFTAYGLVAKTMEWPADRSWVIFNLRPEARWHDGTPITADDVVWSFETLVEKGMPFYRYYYSAIDSAEALNTHRVRFNFKESGNQELPLITGQLPVLPKHYWASRDFSATTLDPPLGSGPYRIQKFEAGRYIVQERVTDYWGANLPVRRGMNNFDIIRTEYFRDATPIRLALKAGDIDFRLENQSKAWADDYNVAVVDKGLLNKEMVPHRQPTGMQAFVMNTRRTLFQDPRVRQALGYAFDFEWSNRTLFNGQYTRTTSYFSNSELASSGLPEGSELALLEHYRGRIPDTVFNQAFRIPVTDGSGRPRENLRKATALLKSAGWSVRDLKLINEATGVPFRFEVLLSSKAFERIVLPYTQNLKLLGIEAKIRLVDRTQYMERYRQKDFDMLVAVWGQSETPGNEQREYWGSDAADSVGSRNLAGIKDPVVDELIELLVKSDSREQLNVRTRALDRVLLWGHYVVPHWHIRADRVLYWDKFSRPATPVRSGVMRSRWWYDTQKAAALEQARQ